MTYLSHLLIRQTLVILLNQKVTGSIHLKPKRLWDLMLKMVFSHNLLYFTPLIMFMDGLYLEKNFRTLFWSVYCFCCCCCSFVIVVIFIAGFVVLLLLFHFFIIFVLILCGFVRYCFLRLLGIPIIYVHGISRPCYVIFNICNFSITFFIELYWILFSYLLTVSFLQFSYSIFLMTILL